ncbi:MAG: adenylate/guanylate cyclase domain-containing protein [Alphaproteobacteria bacterium]|nr:adenylate/guanylate cyclase domain-containing protein [Alphaproteobacteria bacterium]
MTLRKSDAAPAPPLDLDGLDLWIVERGMLGLPLDEQLAGFCQRIYDAGYPMKRAQMGMGTLHPRYGAHTFVWRPGAGAVEHTPRERTTLSRQGYLQSPVYYLRSRGILEMRRRLDTGEPDEFPIFPELRAEGLTEYAARIVPYDPAQAAAVAERAAAPNLPPRPGQALDGVFFSCATDRPEGFDDGHLQQVADLLPYLTLAVKSRSTYDVASTVIETYLGHDAGHRVLTGAIERGSAETIRAVIWFSDLRGFTRLTDTLPRDALIEMLDSYLEAMARPVHANHGQILKFLGDGLLATFDLTDRDEAAVCRDALTAAAELRNAFPAFNEERKAAGKPVMDFGLALHLGEVLYGNIGASDRLDFTVVGPAVNEASRIQALCRPLERNILVSNTFEETAGGAARLESLGFHALRGVREPQELFTLSA